MTITTNLLFLLCQEVIADRTRKRQIVEKILLPEFFQQLEGEDIVEMLDLSKSMRKKTPQIAEISRDISNTCFEANPMLLADSSLIIGRRLVKMNRPKDALFYLDVAEKIYGGVDDSEQHAICQAEIAEIHETLGDYNYALFCIESAIADYIKCELLIGVAQCCLKMGQLNNKLGQFEKALGSYEIAQDIFETSGDDIRVAACKMSAATIRITLGHHDSAILLLKSAKTTFEKHGMQINVADCDVNMAILERKLYKYERSLCRLTSARTLYEKALDKNKVAQCNMIIGNVYLSMGKYENALLILRHTLNYFSENNMECYAASCRITIGGAEMLLGHYYEAMVLFSQARKVCSKRMMIIETADCDFNIAKVNEILGDFLKSMKCLKSARTIYEKINRPIDVARCDMHLAMIVEKLHRPDEALFLCKNAKRVFEESEMPIEVARCDSVMASIKENIGKYEEALILFKSVKDVFCKMPLSIDVARCDENIARLLTKRYQCDEAIVILESAKQVFAENNMYIDIARCNRNIGFCKEQLGQYEECITYYKDARTLFENENFNYEVAKCDVNIANILQRNGEYKEALCLFANAEKEFKRGSRKLDVAVCWMNTGIIMEELGQYTEALIIFNRCENIFKKCKEILNAATTRLNIASVTMAVGEYERALRIYSKSLEHYGHIPKLKWTALFGMGKVYEKVRENGKALKRYIEAIEVIDKVRDNIRIKDSRSSFLRSQWGSYYAIIGLYLEEENYEKALEYLERLKSKTLSEEMHGREYMPKLARKSKIEEYRKVNRELREIAYRLEIEKDKTKTLSLHQTMMTMREKNERMIKTFREKEPEFDPGQILQISSAEIKKLNDNSSEAFVELYYTEEMTIAFIVVNGELRVERIDNYKLADVHEHFRGITERYKAYRMSEGRVHYEFEMKWEMYLESVLVEQYKKIYTRLKPHFYEGGRQTINRVVVIPYGPFHFFPFHAMYEEIDGERHYVVDEQVVLYAPSAKCLRMCRQRRRKKEGKVVIMSANPANTEELVCARAEGDAIRRTFKQAELIENVTKSDMVRHSMDANIIHFIGHGSLHALSLHNEKDRNASENYAVGEIYSELDLREADLVTLSACETGVVTQVGRVDEYVGLTGAFLQAGAATVVSSLWRVSDVSTALLMSKMYEGIKKGKGKAEALQNAQLWLKDRRNRKEQADMLSLKSRDLKDSKKFEFNRPYHWAGVICSGAN